MGNRDVSIVFKANDKLSESVKGMRGSVNGLRADVESFKKLKDETFDKEARIQLDINDAKKKLNDFNKEALKGSKEAKDAYVEQYKALKRLEDEKKSLTKEVKKLTAEDDKFLDNSKKKSDALAKQQKEMENLRKENERLLKLQQEAATAEKELSNARSRNSNANAGLGMGSAAGMMKSLAKAGLGSMLGGAVGDLLGNMTSSAFGSTIGGAVGSIGGNALSGAAMGSIAGPIGTAVGAAVGGLTGAIKSLSDHQNQMDGLYRQEVQSLYNDSITDMENRISIGSSIAAEREMYQRGFETTLGKEAGDKLYADIKEFGDKTAYDTTAMLGKGKEMLAYGIEGKNVMELMGIIGDIAGGNTNNFSGLSYAISQSLAAGKLNAQDKNQMVNYGLNPLEFVAKDQGISVAEATKLMSDGKITADMLMDAMRLAVSEGERFFNGTNALSDTYEAMSGQLESAWNNLEAAAGEKYNAVRKDGMTKEIETLTGENADKMKKAYEMVGAYEAEMENRHQQNIINSMENAAKLIEEQGLTGIEAEKVMWEAKTQAEIDYKNSEEYQKKLQAEKSLVANIQSSLTESGEYVKFGQAMADQFSKGWQSGRLSNAASDVRAQISKEGVSGYINSIFANAYKGTPGGVSSSRKHAAGLKRVPYDGYVAELHEGESVLTRVEADKRSGGSVTIAKLADQIVVREEADIDKIARALVRNMQNMRESFVGA